MTMSCPTVTSCCCCINLKDAGKYAVSWHVFTVKFQHLKTIGANIDFICVIEICRDSLSLRMSITECVLWIRQSNWILILIPQKIAGYVLGLLSLVGAIATLIHAVSLAGGKHFNTALNLNIDEISNNEH